MPEEYPDNKETYEALKREEEKIRQFQLQQQYQELPRKRLVSYYCRRTISARSLLSLLGTIFILLDCR